MEITFLGLLVSEKDPFSGDGGDDGLLLRDVEL